MSAFACTISALLRKQGGIEKIFKSGEVGMRICLLFSVLFCVLSPATGSANDLSVPGHATAMLLLSDSDESIKLAAKSVYWHGYDERELLDVLGEVVWNACSGKQKMDSDTLSWLGKAIGKTRQSRYAELVSYCISRDIHERSWDYMREAAEELSSASAESFVGGHLDLSAIRKSLEHPRASSRAQLVKQFDRLNKNATLEGIYESMGYPDKVGVATTSVGNRANPAARLAALTLTYNDIGVIQFFSEEGQTVWKLDTAFSSKSLLLSHYEGRFIAPAELIKHGNALQLREVADYLISAKTLGIDDFDAIMARIEVPADAEDGELVDSLAWLIRVVFESGNPDYEKRLTTNRLSRGDAFELRRIADHLLGKSSTDKEVLDAVMARISSSRNTQDGNLADSLAWLTKVILKSDDAQYKDGMADISKTAAHRSLRKYAGSAAEGL